MSSNISKQPATPHTAKASPVPSCRIWKLPETSELMKSQHWTHTSQKKLKIVQATTQKLMKFKDVQKLRANKGISSDVKVIVLPPFSNLDRINDSLYLTGIAGLTLENIVEKKITMIINCTYEMQLLNIKGIDSIRVPIDDDESEDILPFIDDVSDIIRQVTKNHGSTIVHCMAGASRSCAFVLGFLVKYQNMTLRNAFCYVNSVRSCVRPNLGFMKQLMIYETAVRGSCSIQMMSVRDVDTGQCALVPDFYRELFPELYNMEIMKQIRQIVERLAKGKQVQPDGTTNYVNMERSYKDIRDEIEKVRKKRTTLLETPKAGHDSNRISSKATNESMTSPTSPSSVSAHSGAITVTLTAKATQGSKTPSTALSKTPSTVMANPPSRAMAKEPSTSASTSKPVSYVSNTPDPNADFASFKIKDKQKNSSMHQNG